MCVGCIYYVDEECTHEEGSLEDNEDNVRLGTCPFYEEYFPERPDQYWREDI